MSFREIDYLAQCRTHYDRNLFQEHGHPIGANETEIAEVELAFGNKFPVAHRQYLKWMGNDISGKLRGSEWFLKDIRDNTSFLREFLEEEGVELKLDRQPVCFFCHQGYMAGWYYLIDAIDDPECYYYSEATDVPEPQVVRSFSAFLLRDLGGMVEIR